MPPEDFELLERPDLTIYIDVLTDEGLDAVTHHRLAEVAGYSRATIYKHWPTRNALFVDAFSPMYSSPSARQTV